MERVDTKYVINYAQADEFIQELKKNFLILQIKDKIIFQYDNIYMDTANSDLFYEHERGDEMRNKIRTRNYTDSTDLCFFEYKHKINKVTRKFRYKCPANEHGIMTEEAQGFFTGIYESLNGEVSHYWLSASLATRYQRITLCAKNSGEKVTIDFGFQFEDLRSGIKHNLNEIVIVESKSNSEHCTTGKIMKKIKVPQAKGCSKYCIGLIYTNRITESKKFQDAIDMIDEISAHANEEKDTQSSKIIKKAVKWVAKIAKAASKKTPTKVTQSSTTKKIQAKIPATAHAVWFRSKKLVTT